MNIQKIVQTGGSKLPTIARILAALPLLGIGIQHAAGLAPMKPILVGAGIPFPDLNAVIAPIFEILAGILLLTGWFSRIGALIAIGSMAVALYAHVVFDWADEPPMALPIVIIALCVFVIVKGAGFLSVDRKLTNQ